MEAQFPELVTRWGPEQYRAVDYGCLAAVLIEGLKELRAEKDGEIAALKAENSAQQKEIESLQARIAALEEAMRQVTEASR